MTYIAWIGLIAIPTIVAIGCYGRPDGYSFRRGRLFALGVIWLACLWEAVL